MPFRGYPVDPSNKQGKVKATLSLSPKLCLSDPGAELLVTIAIGLDSSPSPSHKGQAITICTEKSIFDVFSEGEGGLFLAELLATFGTSVIGTRGISHWDSSE